MRWMMTKRKAPEDKLKTGRPTDYNSEIAQRICLLVATHPIGLGRLVEQYPDLPAESSINLWRWKHPEFSEQYHSAKCQQAQLYAEETLELCREKNILVDSDGNQKLDAAHVQWIKLNVNTRQWHASKLATKVYGDKMQIESNVDDNEKLKAELAELRKQLAKKSKKDY